MTQGVNNFGSHSKGFLQKYKPKPPGKCLKLMALGTSCEAAWKDANAGYTAQVRASWGQSVQSCSVNNKKTTNVKDHIDLGLSHIVEATMQRWASAQQHLDLEHDDLGVSMVDIVYIFLTGRKDGSLDSRELCELGNASCSMHCC